MTIQHKKVLITGADGFIGSYLTKALIDKNYSVSVLVKNNNLRRLKFIKDKIEILIGDINDPNLKLDKYDIIYHLAALTDLKKCSENPKLAFNENVLGTINLLSNINNKSKFILISTLGVYGEPKYFPVNEDHTTYPIEPYAASKLASENFVLGFCKSREINYCIVRLFNVYGPGQRNDFVIPMIINQFLNNKKLQLNNLDSSRDFIFIDDVINALIKIGESENSEIYNVGTGKETTIKEIIEILKKITQMNIKQEILKKRGLKNTVRRSVADISKIQKEIGWHPSVDINDGLLKTWRYYGASRINR